MQESPLLAENEDFDYHDIKSVNILILVCCHSVEDKLTERLRNLGVRGILVIRGKGAARASITELLGFTDTNKSIILGVAHDDTPHEILNAVGAEFFNKHGAGVGLSIKAAGFAGARFLFKNFVEKLIRDEEAAEFLESTGIDNIKPEEISEFLKSQGMSDIFKAGIIHEFIKSEDMQEQLQTKSLLEILSDEEVQKILKEKRAQIIERAKEIREEIKKKIEEPEEKKSEAINEQVKEQVMPSENKLIMTIVNRGYSEEVMDAAREKGATGGTIIWGRGTGRIDKSFFGIRIEPEKEIVMIICSNDKCKGIVEAINEKAGLKTPGSGICFILPVDEVVGLTPINNSEL